MSDPLKDIARVVHSFLRTMKMLAEGGKEKYGDWVFKVQGGLTTPLARAYGGTLRSLGGVTDKVEIEVVARQRALETAKSICDTTTTWLQEGRDESSIFGEARAAQIAVTETSWAVNTAKMVACKQKGRKVRWRLNGKGCKVCKRLHGRVRIPGKVFVVHDGKAVYGPPIHPHCKCSLSQV